MKRHHSDTPARSRHSALLRLVLALALASAATEAAAGNALSPRTYQQLVEIHAQIEQESYGAAVKALKQLLPSVSHLPYEKAVVLQTLGYVQTNRDAYPAAIRAFEDSLALEQLPEQTQQRLRYDLAQLYLTVEKPDKAAHILEDWFKLETKPAAPAHALLGYSYARQQRYREAIPQLKRAIELAAKPRAEWYEALLAMHYGMKSYRDCVSLLTDMIRLFPARTRYWQQLAGCHLALNEHESALIWLELALHDGALSKQQELIQLARLYLHTGAPYKGARLIQEQMGAGRIENNARHRALLARAWSMAREREEAILALEQAVASDPKPELRLQLAQWYFEAQRWQAAASVLQTLIADGAGSATGRANLLLGIARFELGDAAAARKAFSSALQSRETEQSAQQWLNFVRRSSADGA